MSTQPKSFLTPEQYLEIERKAEFKSEYFRGEMFAMSGANRAHSLLTTNLIGHLYPQLANRDCELYSSQMRLRVTPTGLYTYPDFVAVRGKPQFIDDQVDTVLDPIFIAEILSPATEAYDRGRKFEHYRSLESLSEYLLVAQDRVAVDLYTRQANGLWLLTGAGWPEDTLELRSIECQLSIAELYRKVPLPGEPGAPSNPS